MTASPKAKAEIPIVLTATVIPNAVVAAAADPQSRLSEYIQALKFYSQFAPIIFLENSAYPLEQHSEFSPSPRLQVKRLPLSDHPKRGKGYQEFEMIDAWLRAEPHPPERWLKISGRYQVWNIRQILEECQTDPHSELIIDQLKRLAYARTYLFCVTTSFYQRRLNGLYRQCDDSTGNFIEKVLFNALEHVEAQQIRLFRTQPRLIARDGASGMAFPSGRGQWLGKQILRNLNRLFDRKYQWYSR